MFTKMFLFYLSNTKNKKGNTNLASLQYHLLSCLAAGGKVLFWLNKRRGKYQKLYLYTFKTHIKTEQGGPKKVKTKGWLV